MGFSYLLVAFLVLAVSVRSQLQPQDPFDYCDPKLKLCEVPSDHVMCKYPEPGLSPRCSVSSNEPLSVMEKKKILFWHNKFRSNIANGTEKNKKSLPPASNMRQIYWDNELEKLAERWAEQCISLTSSITTDRCRNTQRFRVSQNVGVRVANATSIDMQTTQIVAEWFKGRKDLDPSLIDKYIPTGNDKPSINHFVNMIWADTYAIGCARVVFQENLITEKESTARIWSVERLVCNYGPGGNEVGKAIYKRGNPCQNCPSGTQCSTAFPGLCASQMSNADLDKTERQQNVENQEKPSEKADGDDLSKEQKEEEEEAGEPDWTKENTANECHDENCGASDRSNNSSSSNTPKGPPKSLLNFPRPTGAKYFVKTGVFLNGKCHCTDVYRSAGRLTHSPSLWNLISGFVLCPLTILLWYF